MPPGAPMKKLFLLLLLPFIVLPAKADNPAAVLNEIAWMGTEASYNDEWIELKNTTEAEIDVTGWIIKDTDDKLEIILEGIIPSQGYFVLERTDDTTLPEIEADQIYTGALKNSGIGLILLDSTGNAVDNVENWVAGNNDTKETMQREALDKWCTFMPTPKAENTCPEPEPEVEEVIQEELEINEPPVIQPVEIEEEVVIEEVELRAYSEEDITFIKVLPNPDGEDKGNEWIELKNNTNKVINLKEWKLLDAKPSEFTFDFWEVYPGESVKFFQTAFKLNLNNKEDHLSLIDPMGNVIDTMEWKSAQSGQVIFQTRYLVDGIPGTVTRIVDGDTFVATVNEQPLKIRLIGVDTPETVHPRKGMEWFGKRAHKYLEDKLLDKEVIFDFEERKMDRYGRLLAYVFIEGEFINAEIIKGGYGHAYTRFPFRYLEEFKQFEAEAKSKKLGLWESKTSKALVALEKTKMRYDPDELTEAKNLDLELKIEVEPEEAPALIGPKCLSEHLKIEAIMPAPEKGGHEFIRIKNTGKETVCLSGWSLDDNQEKGSKPFKITGGSIAPNGVRTFRRTETGIALNNSNDCAHLIDETGQSVDHICYGKTHKNEVFTHEGGDYVPKAKVVKTKAKKTVKRIKTERQDPLFYKWDLAENNTEALVESIDPETGTIMVKLIQKEAVPVMLSEHLDINIVGSLIDLEKPIQLQLDGNELIAVHQEKPQKESSDDKVPNEIVYGFLLINGTMSLAAFKFFII